MTFKTKILIAVFLVCAGANSAGAGIVNNSGSDPQDSLTVPLFILDTLGDVVGIDSTADWGYIIVWRPGGDTAATDSFLIKAANIDKIKKFGPKYAGVEGFSYRRPIASIDGAGGSGTYPYLVMVRDSSQTSWTPIRGEFQLYTTNNLSEKLDSTTQIPTGEITTGSFTAGAIDDGAIADGAIDFAGEFDSTGMVVNLDAVNGDTSAASGLEGAFDNDLDSTVRLDLRQLRIASSMNDALLEPAFLSYNHGAGGGIRTTADSGDALVATTTGPSGDAMRLTSTGSNSDALQLSGSAADLELLSTGLHITGPTTMVGAISIDNGMVVTNGLDIDNIGLNGTLDATDISTNFADKIGFATNNMGDDSGGWVSGADTSAMRHHQLGGTTAMGAVDLDAATGTLSDAQIDLITTTFLNDSLLGIFTRLNAIRDSMDEASQTAAGGGSCDCGNGAQTVTIKVADTSGTYTVVPNAKVSIIVGATSVWAITNGSGIATLYLDPATYTAYAYANGYNFTAKSIIVPASSYADSILGYDVATAAGGSVPSTQQATLYDWAITPANDTLYGAEVAIMLSGSTDFFTSTVVVPPATVVVYAGLNDGSANGGKWAETIFGTDSLFAPGTDNATYNVTISHPSLKNPITYEGLSVPAGAAIRLRTILDNQD